MASKKVSKAIVKKESKSIELKRLVIKIGDKELNLTPDEAKSLKGILDELFEESEKIERIIVQPYPYPYYPVIYYEPYKWTKTYTYPQITYTTPVSVSSGIGNVSTWYTSCNDGGTFTCTCGQS